MASQISEAAEKLAITQSKYRYTYLFILSKK